MQRTIEADAWSDYHRNGYLRLGRVCGEDELDELRTRIDEIMMGTAPIDFDRLMMQLDANTEDYSKVKGGGMGHQRASLNYRKIQGLEFDPIFLAFMQKPVFREVAAYVYGAHTDTTCFRAMFMNKPAEMGSFLPWHQDAGGSFHIDRDPLVTIWTALDDATVENGCMQIVPGSHTLGILSEQGFKITEEQEREICPEEKIVDVEVKAGDAVVLHNWLLHRSGVNQTSDARRAFSVCYLDARTVSDRGTEFSLIFGEGAMKPEEL